MRSTLRTAALLAGASTIAGVYFASQIYLNPALGTKLTFDRALAINLTYYYLWALAAPLIVRAARRFPIERQHWPTAVVVHAATSLALTSVIIVIAELVLDAAGVRQGSPRSYLPFAFALNFHGLLPTYWMVLLAALSFEYYVRARDREVRTAQLEGRLTEARLTALKAQLQPHFLFNTLNSISSLMYVDVAAADRMLTRLADLLRLTIDRDRQIVPLRDELDLVRRYLAIEAVRFEDRLTVDYAIEPQAEDLPVPSLLLQPIVENAIRHSIARRERGGCLRISASCTRDGLHLQVEDDGPGLPQGHVPQLGVGLGNADARLAQLYGGRSTLQLTNTADGRFAVKIVIPLEPAVP